MILKVQDLSQRVKKNKIFLFHGVNEGYKQSILKENFEQLFAGSIFKYYEREIFSNIDNFYNQVLSKSFFEEKKLIIIKDVSEKIRSEIEILKEKELGDILIILISSILDKKSKLRNFFEKEKDLVSVAFYSDNNQTLSTMAKEFFLKNKISISQESINLIVNRANGERRNLINELEKIKNYLIDKKKVSKEEIYNLTNLSENYSISELVDNCLAKNKQKTIYILNENNFSMEDAVIITRIFLIKTKRLLKLGQNFKISKNSDQTILNFKPPIFWKDKELVKKQMNNWTVEKIYNLINEINKIELDIKKNSLNSLNILFDFILNTSTTSN